MSQPPKRQKRSPGANGDDGSELTPKQAEWVAFSDAFEAGPTNRMTQKTFTDKYNAILKKRKELPVHQQKEEFLGLIEKHQIIVLVGETGSGKTTQYAK